MTEPEKIAICTTCPLSACVTDRSPRCPLVKAQKKENQERERKRGSYSTLRKREKRANKAAGRGYWPEVHGRV